MITRDQIQAIVDGECSDDLRAILLREIESQPAGWRTLALALLEEQQWSKQISSLGISDHPAQLTPNSPATLFDSIAERYSSQVRPLLSLPDAEPVSLIRGSKVRAFCWMPALAASLLFGFGVFGGSYLPKFTLLKSDRGDIQSVATAKNQADPIGKYEIPNGKIDTEMKMLVSGPNKETAEIPIYDHKAIDHDVFEAREKYEVAKINQRLRKEGFELDVRSEYYTGQLNDGRQLIVPVKHVGVKPYGQ